MAYWWQKEEQKDSGKKSSDQQTGEQGYWWQKENFSSTIGNNITSRVNKWLENHNNYISNYQKRYAGRKYSYEDSYVNDSGSWLETINKQKSAFDAEADSILAYMDQYSRYLDADWVKSVKDTLTGARGQQSSILESATKDNEWWSSFGSEELVKAYGSAEDAYKYYQRADGYTKKYTGMGDDDIKNALSTLNDGEEKNWLDSYQWRRYFTESDFDKYANAGAAIKNPTVTEAESDGRFLWWEWDGADIGNIVTYSRENADVLAMAGANNENTKGNYVYRNMEDDEVKLYNYLLAKYGKEKGDEFLSYLMDDLNRREGGAMANRLRGIDIPVVEELAIGAFGTLAGVDQWASGARQFLTNEKQPTTVEQYANTDLANSMTGLGKYAYQATNVIGNMLPSIALSKGLGALGAGVKAAKAIGAVTMSVGAAGNAYTDGLEYGMEPWQARIYSTLVGASEGALEYAIGGIPALRGADDFVGSKIALIDNALLRIGSKIGWDIVQEIGEEELQNFLEPAFRAIFTHEYDAPTIDELIETAIVTAISTPVMGGGDTIINDIHGAKAAINKYGNKTDALIQEGLQNDVKSNSYKLAQKYQQQTQSKNGKAMTGAQIRNLLAANQEQVTVNDMQKIQKAAESRLVQKGQKENVTKLAELAAKYVTGQELSRSEKSFLANSKIGAQVTSEMLNAMRGTGSDKLLSKWENDMSEGWDDSYATEWAENIDTKGVYGEAQASRRIRAMLDAVVEDPAAYKSLEERVGTEGRFGVSESGQATIRATGKAFDFDNAEVVEVGDGQMSFKREDGGKVSAGGIDFVDANQSFLVSAVSNIENITPAAATSIMHEVVDMSKPMGQQLNGIDEAFTYGYHGYSEADLKAGNFVGNLTNEQMMRAYELGKAARAESIDVDETKRVNMRTAAEAKMTAEQKTAKQKARIEADDVEVYFQDGKNVVKFDKKVGKYDNKRKAAVNTAKFLSKLGIGGKYYFFESYVNADGERVYKDADGNEVEAPNGAYYDSDGSIHIDLNAGDYGQGTALFTMGHELGHFVKDKSEKQFQRLADLVTEAYSKTDMSMHKRVLAKQKFLEDKRGEDVSYDEAYEEVVCDALSTMLTDGTFHEKLMEIKVKDKGLFNTIKRFFEDMIAKFREIYAKLTPDQKDAQDIRAVKDMFDKIQTAFAEALVEASDNFHASMESVVEAKSEAISADEIITDGAVVTDGEGTKRSIRSMKHDIADGKMFEDLKKVCGWTDAQVITLRKQLNDLVEYMIPYRDILDMNESYGREGRRFSPYKPNSDPLYKISMDFSTLCSKRLLTQYVIENLQLREGRPMSAEEQMAIRDMLNEYRKVEKGLQVACAMCYVEAARLKSPKQIQRWLDDPTPHLINYFALKNSEFNASVKKAQADFKESKGYDRNAPKKDMKQADVRELNKIGPRLRSQYQLSAEEQAIVEKAKTLPNSTYLTAGNLANLSETDPAIYDAYTAFVRTATRSKSLETDEPYYYGDSRRDNGNGIIVSDSFIEAVNRENGMRFSSWSDWRIQHMLDYITAVIDNSVRGAAMHGYTKFGEEVRVLGKTGMMFNMSGVAGTQNGLNPDGSLSFSDTESIDVNEAIQLREEFPDTAGLQCIGVSNEHIIALLRSDIIDYVIPYHVSGLNAALRRMADIHGWKDYTGTQHAAIDKSIKLEDAVDKEHWHEEPVYSEFFVGYDTGMTGIEAMRASAEKYKQLCHDRGLTPKFNQFANEDNYWKLLIDRKMINQKTGNLIKQKAVTPTFDFNTIKGVVDRYVQNYDAGLESRALNHIVENWDSIPQRIKDLKKGSKAKKAADTLANQTVAAQPNDGEKRSDRRSSVENQDKIRYSNRYEKRFFPGNVFPSGQTHTAVAEWANRKDTQSGDKRLVAYSGEYYRVQKFDDMDFGYLITKKYDAQDYEEELREYGEIDSEESVQSGFDEIVTRSGETTGNGPGGYHADSSGSGYGSEDNRLLEMDAAKHGRRENSGQTERDRQSGLRDQRQTGRNEKLEWTPQELYDKMLDLDRKLVFAEGSYATRLKNQRERYAQMIDEKRGWDKVHFSERGTSKRGNAPVFYSQMGKVVESMKQEKFGASSVISMLRGRGVKAEEIRWSGIQAFLDGKKSVTKAELMEFIQGSMLQIEEEHRVANEPRDEFVREWQRLVEYLDEDEIIDGLNYIDTSLEPHLEDLVENEDLNQSEADYLMDLARKAVNSKNLPTKWDEYILNGGSNYRELVFKMPGSDYSNRAMEAHWGEENTGVLAHARMQDFGVDGKKMLFIEEIQSDWHNEGNRSGYGDSLPEAEKDRIKAGLLKEFVESDAGKAIVNKTMKHFGLASESEAYQMLKDEPANVGAELIALYPYWMNEERTQAIIDLQNQFDKLDRKKAPDAPFKDNYHEYVLKRLLRMAAEEGYDSIGWTTADIQSKRWSEEYAEGYRIEYDQDIPKFLKKYGKQWGATVGMTDLGIEDGRNARERSSEFDSKVSKYLEEQYGYDDGFTVGTTTDGVLIARARIKGVGYVEVTESDLGMGQTMVWSMDITPAMKKSVLEDGQAMYSERGDGASNRSLLANAFEGIAQNSDEYKMIQQYRDHIAELNKLEAKLSDLNADIRKMLFDKNVERDAKKLKELQDEAKEVAGEINKHDKKLLQMEASEPLRKVIERERKKASQKTKDHVKELIQNKKARAEQTELRHKIRKTVRDLDKILNRGNKKQNVKEDMKDLVSKALKLADYLFADHISNDDLIRRGITVSMRGNEPQLVKETEEILSQLYDNADSLTDEEFTRLDAKRKANEERLRELLKAQRNEMLNTPVSKLFDDLVKAYASLKNSSQDAVKAAYNEELEKSLRAFMSDDSRVKILENMRVADMTAEELNWLYRAYTMVLTNVRDANKFHVKSKMESIDKMAEAIVWDFGSRKIPDGKVAIVARNLANKIGWDYEKLHYALDRIGSEAFTELIMNLANSENIVMEDIIEAAAFRDKIVEKHGFNNWAVNKEIDREFLDTTGKKFKLTLGQLMSLYAYSRREGAWDHIEYGGFVFGEAALTNPKPADSYKLSKEQCEAITSTLTKEQKAYVEDMQKFLSETMGAKGNEVSMQLYGIKMFGEKNYFPIHVAGQFKAQAQESQAKAAAGFGTMSNAGFTHSQNPNAKAPFVLEGFNEVWTDHVNEMSRYHGTVPALEDIRRVMNRSSYSDAYLSSMSVKAVMENAFGKDAVDYFDNLYREANSGAITDKLQKKSKKLLSLFRKNSVAYSLSVLVQQPASLVRAYALIDRKYFGFKGVGAITSGVAKAVTSKWNPAYTNAYNEMMKYAPGVTMAKEIGGFDTATGGSIRSYLLDTNKSTKQKWKTEDALGKGKAVLDLVDNNAIANLPNVADKIAWIEIWNACKRETLTTHKDLAANSEEFMQAVGERFTEVIRATQVYDSIFAKSPMLKSKNLAVQYLVSFMNEPNTIANMVEKAMRDVHKGDWKQGARTAHVVIHSIIFTNLLKSMIYALRDDDEDETYIEKYIEAVTGNLMSDFNPLNYVPIARDVWSIAQGYDVERADMAIVADALDALDQVFKNAFADTADMTEEELVEFDKKVTDANWKLVESLAAFFGIPVKNVRREIEAVIDHARIASANAGLTTKLSRDDTIYEAVIESIPFMSSKKKSKGDKLYAAIIDGDQTYLGRIKATYKDDDAYHTAVRTALRENDPRVKEAALAHINGDPSERVRIAKLIIADGFDLDDVITAINSEINKLTDDGEESAKKVKGYYKAEDFVREAANGDTESLDDIREDIIQTAQANGKTAEEAEKDFASDIKSEAKKAYLSGALDDSTAEKLLTEYVDMDEEETAETISYWAFQKEYPEYKDLSQSNVQKYYEFAEPAEIPLEIFQQYVDGTKDIVTIYDEWGDELESKRDQVLAFIDSLPLTWKQKDALYLAHGYSESKIWDVPW